ncbi:MAG: type II secretion system protein [Planctomycetota bacterium]|jgi:prepilin-type N-terminal cleavage/methylation domain-containing protein
MRSRRGFTLIELLVVIAIIALLMAILMPALNRVKKQARAVVCEARLKQWGLMFAMYTDDHDGYFNPGWDVGESATWMIALRPYYKDNKELLLCPMATKLMSRHGFGPEASWERMVSVPEGGEIPIVSSYTINSWTNYMKGDRGHRKKEQFWKNVQGVKNASNIPVLVDGTWNDAWTFPHDNPPEFNGQRGGGGSFGTTDEMQHFCIGRHSAFVNGAFMDWTVRKIGLKELWALKWSRDFSLAGPWTKAGGVQLSDWPQWMRSFKDY